MEYKCPVCGGKEFIKIPGSVDKAEIYGMENSLHYMENNLPYMRAEEKEKYKAEIEKKRNEIDYLSSIGILDVSGDASVNLTCGAKVCRNCGFIGFFATHYVECINKKEKELNEKKKELLKKIDECKQEHSENLLRYENDIKRLAELKTLLEDKDITVRKAEEYNHELLQLESNTRHNPAENPNNDLNELNNNLASVDRELHELLINIKI